MALYWDTPPSSNDSKSTGTKLAAVIIIVMILIGTGIAVLFQLIPSPVITNQNTKVRVAVVDSGLDQSITTSSQVVAQRSFILPQYGYSMTDTSTTDSNPSDGSGNTVRHGTLVTQTIVANSPNAQIVVAKVIDSSGSATTEGLIAAIYWAIEENCSVINLSLGSPPTVGDPLKEVAAYAFSKGVIIVSAAGNDGSNGLAGTSISSPAVYPEVVSVAALDANNVPSSYSSQGPTIDRYMKPDIAAEGSVQTSSAIYYGTSFSSPRVAADVAELISYCISENFAYTAGSIIAALLLGATPLSYPEYEVGAGLANLQGAIKIIYDANKVAGLPILTYVDVKTLPLDFETLFQGDNYTFDVRIITSTTATYNVNIAGIPNGVIDLPSSVAVNQSAVIPLGIHVPYGSSAIQGEVSFMEGSNGDSLNISIAPTVADYKIAFDISHTTWTIDSVYGQFRELYKLLTKNDISVTEIRSGQDVTSDYLSNFDAVFILDPCAYDINETDVVNPSIISIPFSTEEIQAYEQYFNNGGGIFVAALDNSTLNVAALNDFLSWTGMTLTFTGFPSNANTVAVTNIAVHPITVGVGSFDFNGAPLNVNSSVSVLGRYAGYPVLGCLQGAGGGRIVVTGTNFFIDNWGITGTSPYLSHDNDILALRIALWLVGGL
jgi:hypothetical protein